MSTQSTKQSGFSMVAGVIAAVIVIGIVVFIGWRLYDQSDKQANDNTSNSQNTNKTPISDNNQTTPAAQQTDPNAGYFVIKEWGVRFKPISGLNNIEYVLKDNNSKTDFTTQEVAQQIPSCNAQNDSPGIESLTRFATNAEQPINATLLTTIRGYNYYYGGNQAPCADPSNISIANNNLVSTDSTNLRSSIKSLEAAQ